MAGDITMADLGSMAEVATKIQTGHGDLTQQVRGVDSRVEQLRGEWKSPAADRFYAFMAEWKGEADRLLTALDNMRTKLNDVAGRRVTQLDEENQMLGQLAGDRFGNALNPR